MTAKFLLFVVIALIVAGLIGLLIGFIFHKFTGEKFDKGPAVYAIFGCIVSLVIYKCFGFEIAVCVGIGIVIFLVISLIATVVKEVKYDK